jgi:outer membrane murein-binding lipoprotein Lpp
MKAQVLRTWAFCVSPCIDSFGVGPSFALSQTSTMRLAAVLLSVSLLAGCGGSGGDRVEVVSETKADCPAPSARLRLSSDAMTAAELRNVITARLKDRSSSDPCAVQFAEAAGVLELSVSDPDVVALITRSGLVTFQEVLGDVDPASLPDSLPPDVLKDAEGRAYSLGESLASGNIVASAEAVVSGAGQWTVDVAFTDTGSVEWDSIAERLYQQRLAIVTDGMVLSAPVMQEKKFFGRAQISGNFSASEAKTLATALGNPFSGNLKVETLPAAPVPARGVRSESTSS